MTAADQTAVLLTGGAGYIGSHVYYALAAHGFTPVVMDNLSTGLRSNLPADAIFYQNNVEDVAALEAILKDRKISAIMHFAGSIDASESFANPAKYQKNNVEVTRILIAAAEKFNVRGFVFSSSAAIYGHQDEMPVAEDATPRPVSPYGQSKLDAENDLQASALNTAILRYFNVGGADSHGRTGPTGLGPVHIVKAAVSHYLGQSPALTIYGRDYDTPDGTCIRDFIHVSDLAEIHVLALKNLLKDGQSFVMNCGYGRGISIQSLADALRGLPGGENIKIEYGPRREADVPEIYADISLLQKKLTWTPRHNSIEQIIKTEIEWEKRKLSRTQNKLAAAN